mmetsp:Transcript_73499/g.129727  ORF Transcript_73499/g.129727 Transcript_73499/m.129727 type:complete len:192 (+) Transcript_73499:95-670(+)|eukprot:CAMPEP_0197652618 /NCGR_PEP_ID=MMETSP1338-20131121/34562_1 /TAXON_ID=43686 ORGANISM="Pelagodinium beii, Strain RCC1491" /NCGR_SAMPLE_ID=MMETSP1338 /ASSEMBLY_ACC=CAM_ASM_000754 /LENGTH=191 /DNA_ID=CAMNT_0043227535 /DNA_START=70 /DNA_END=645 /DNA_ORIENTATION=-
MARTQVMPIALLLVVGCFVARQFGSAFVGPVHLQRNSVAMRAEDEAPKATGDRMMLKVMSPEGNSFEGQASEVILPSASGQLGVLSNHAPMMSALDTGVLRYKQDGTWMPLVILGGFASVESNSISVLVNDFEEASEIDMDEAKKTMDSATAALEAASDSENKKDKLDATAAVKKAAARLQAAMFISGSKK